MTASSSSSSSPSLHDLVLLGVALGLCFFAVCLLVRPAAHVAALPAARHVFVDVGGHNGDSLAAFLTVGVPGGLARQPAHFDDVVVFEPSSVYHECFERFRGKGFGFRHLQAAASVRDGRQRFVGGELGGGLLLGDQRMTDYVWGFDFSRWLNATVTHTDFVVCKLDAHGADNDILQRMREQRTLCLCDRFAIATNTTNDVHAMRRRECGSDFERVEHWWPHVRQPNSLSVYRYVSESDFVCV